MNVNNQICFVILFSCGILTTFGQLSSGSQCTVERTRNQGICRKLNECPDVVNDIIKRKPHTRCGFSGRTEIVCCPLQSGTTTTTPLPPRIDANSRISERKCEEYKSAVYVYQQSLSLSVDAEPVRIPIDRCGHKSIPLIVGGEFAKGREFPHMALIGFDVGGGSKSWDCGGTLISDEYVLTAGHCLRSGLYGEPKYVRLGELNLNATNDDAAPEDYNIAEVIGHPNYRRSSKYNDIGLLKLDRKVKLDPYKRPACLPTSFDGPERKAIATGWGDTSWSGDAASHLQKVILDKFTQNECNSSYQYDINRKLQRGIVPETQLCAGSKNEEKDTCQGDSGGPLQVYHLHQYCMYTVIGVTSFGITCGNPGIPGVYTRVFAYLDWIESVVWG